MLYRDNIMFPGAIFHGINLIQTIYGQQIRHDFHIHTAHIVINFMCGYIIWIKTQLDLCLFKYLSDKLTQYLKKNSHDIIHFSKFGWHGFQYFIMVI